MVEKLSEMFVKGVHERENEKEGERRKEGDTELRSMLLTRLRLWNKKDFRDSKLSWYSTVHSDKPESNNQS